MVKEMGMGATYLIDAFMEKIGILKITKQTQIQNNAESQEQSTFGY